jgi:hypothetical protein
MELAALASSESSCSCSRLLRHSGETLSSLVTFWGAAFVSCDILGSRLSSLATFWGDAFVSCEIQAERLLMTVPHVVRHDSQSGEFLYLYYPFRHTFVSG